MRENKTATVIFKLTEPEKKDLIIKSGQEKMSMSNYIRKKLNYSIQI